MVVRCRVIIDVVRRVAPFQINQSKQTGEDGNMGGVAAVPEGGQDQAHRSLQLRQETHRGNATGSEVGFWHDLFEISRLWTYKMCRQKTFNFRPLSWLWI